MRRAAAVVALLALTGCGEEPLPLVHAQSLAAINDRHALQLVLGRVLDDVSGLTDGPLCVGMAGGDLPPELSRWARAREPRVQDYSACRAAGLLRREAGLPVSLWPPVLGSDGSRTVSVNVRRVAAVRLLYRVVPERGGWRVETLDDVLRPRPTGAPAAATGGQDI